MMHDKGLSTNIDWRDKDAYGNSLSSNQRQKMQRLRKWNERFRTRDSKERNLKQALGEIDRMASALGLPENVRETAICHLPPCAGRRPPSRTLHRGCLDSVRLRRRATGWRPTLARRDHGSLPRREERIRPDVPLRRPRTLARSAPGRPRQYVPRFASSRNCPTRPSTAPASFCRTQKSRASTLGSHRSASPPPPSTPPHC